jgi:hypothetical protein
MESDIKWYADRAIDNIVTETLAQVPRHAISVVTDTGREWNDAELNRVVGAVVQQVRERLASLR